MLQAKGLSLHPGVSRSLSEDLGRAVLVKTDLDDGRSPAFGLKYIIYNAKLFFSF